LSLNLKLQILLEIVAEEEGVLESEVFEVDIP
jgi:hypothetical protein